MFGSTKILGGCNSTGRVSRYLTDLVQTTEVCLVTYTENLSNVWTTADYPLCRLVSHIWHEGVPPFSQGEWWTVLYARKCTCRMSCVFLAAMQWEDLGTDYGVYFFRFHGVASLRDGITDDFL